MNQSVLKQLIPPLVWRGICRIRRRWIGGPTSEPEGRKEAGWYDDVYAGSAEYAAHYTESRYYFMWSVIADRLIRSGARRVIDLGCGPGQVARLLCDKGLSEYCGLDFSAKSVELAGRICPEFEFRVADICKGDLLEAIEYDSLVTLEFLEHIDEDTEVLSRIRSGTHVLATVPNFPYVSHVRHFNNSGEVLARYGEYFDQLRVDTFLEDKAGKAYFLLDGKRR